MGANAQVCLEKFARYFEVEARLVPVSEESRYCLDVKKAAEARRTALYWLTVQMCDENTIGVFVILGSTCPSAARSTLLMRQTLATTRASRR